MLNGYKIVAICLSRIYDTPIIEFVSELNERLGKQGYKIFLYQINKDFAWDEKYQGSEAYVFELIDYSVVDTVVIMDETIKSRTLSENIIKRAKAANVPVVIVDGSYDNCINVQFDYKKGFEKIVRHVMDEHKPQKVHFMAGTKGDKFSKEREDVFRNVMKEYGVTVDYKMISYGDFWADPTIEAMNELLDKGVVPDAFICANDIMAINVIAVLKSRGYRVPEDVIVTGFDGVEEVHLTEPRVTTAVCDYTQLANTVIELILSDVTSGNYYPPPALLVSESCGCTYNSKINILDSFSSLNRRFYRYQDDNRILTEIAEKVQNCIDIEEVPLKMDNKVISHMCCVLNESCLDDTKDPILPSDNSFDENMCLLYDAIAPKPFLIQNFKRTTIVPHIDVLLSRKYPLIFASLDYMNRCIGYLCFYFDCCDSANYGRIPQIVNSLNTGIGGLISQRYHRYLTKRIEHIYTHDALTGLNNRLGFSQKCDKLINQAKENSGIITIVLADLDELKFINDNFGHVSGDNAIHMVAKALKHGCPLEALCVRFGGDEMLAVIEGECDTDLIKTKISKFLDDYNATKQSPYTVSASVGIFQVKATEDISFEALLKEVDVRMYEDKKNKKLKKNNCKAE